MNEKFELQTAAIWVTLIRLAGYAVIQNLPRVVDLIVRVKP